METNRAIAPNGANDVLYHIGQVRTLTDDTAMGTVTRG
jgi:hypothetical protein